MKKTALSLFLFLIVVMLSAMTFTGNTMLSVHEAEGASDETLSELRRKAEQGNAYAQFNLGIMYRFGQVVPQNYAEATSWFRKAAEQGLADAQYVLGTCYEFGEGVPQNYAEAAKWYRKAAEQGEISGQYFLGFCYELGHGVPQNYKTAYIWYSLAAAKVSGKFRKDVVDARDRVAKRLSPAALEQAQDIAREWRPKK